ncbi:MAG: vanadium-dependent haloperoxidase, partial [Acidimicrobiales bacterium]
MRRTIAGFVVASTLLAGAALSTPARAVASAPDNAVARWNGIASDAILADTATRSPSAAALYVAIVQAAVYNATMAIEKTHTLYRSSLSAPSGASVDAAVAAAAYGVLARYFPAQQASLDATYAAALAEIPEGEAKTQG